MQLFISKLIGSIVQILLFSLVPLIWWLISARKKENFLAWTGIRKIENAKENKVILWMTGVTAAFLILSVFMLISLKGTETAASEFQGMGAGALPAILVYAALNTALPEEIVFRGFLLKRISDKFGFAAGNIVQSAVFGLLHGAMFFSLTGAVKAVLIILFTGGIGWCMGYINEKKAGGSIIPSWCIHTIANIFSGLCAAFALFS